VNEDIYKIWTGVTYAYYGLMITVILYILVLVIYDKCFGRSATKNQSFTSSRVRK